MAHSFTAGDSMHAVRLSRCPLCETALNPLEARVILERPESHVVHIRCRSCGHALLALVSFSEEGVFSIGLVTDCSPEDVVAFGKAPPLSLEDVLSAHEALADQGQFWAGLHKNRFHGRY